MGLPRGLNQSIFCGCTDDLLQLVRSGIPVSSLHWICVRGSVPPARGARMLATITLLLAATAPAGDELAARGKGPWRPSSSLGAMHRSAMSRRRRR